MTTKRLLFVDSDPSLGVFWQALLRNHGFIVDVAASTATIMERFHYPAVHAVIISDDFQLSECEINGFAAAAEFKRRVPVVPVVVVSICESVAEDAIRFVDGAFCKLFPAEGLVDLLQRLVDLPGPSGPRTPFGGSDDSGTSGRQHGIYPETGF